jgi:ATP-dependent Clp protease ATP-binding subunit ClpA
MRRVLKELGADFAGLASKILELVPARDAPRPATLDEAPGLAESIDRAASFAAERHSTLIRPEHLLLAIAAGQGVAASALASVGATPQRVRAVIDKMSG